MKRSLILVYGCCWILLIISCANARRPSTETASPTLSFPLYEVEYVNWASGFTHGGIVVTASGDVYRYSLPRGNPFLSADDSLVSRQYLLDKISYSNSLVCHLPRDTMEHYLAMQRGIRDGPYTERTQTGADRGGMLYKVYREEGRHFRRTILGLIGDWSYQHTDSSATVIVEWLERTMWRCN